jgi:adenosylcobinamide-GDP ribazoletransferase
MGLRSARLAELVAALMLLTRLPVVRFAAAEPPGLADSAWAWPVAGALVGAAGGAVVWLGAALRVPAELTALWALAAMAVVTGGLHEDGLADTADGIGGGRDPAHRLAIMRDSRIGSFGALALILSVALRAAAIAELGPDAVGGLIAVAALSRAAMLAPVLLTGPARHDGLAAGLATLRWPVAAAGAALAAVAALLLLPRGAAITAILAAGVSGWAMAALARRRLGGYTGDVLGAAAVLADCAVLTVVATALPA